MNESRSEALSAFSDAVAVWRLARGAVADVIDAATQCLVDGIDSPSLCELAGASPRDSYYDLRPLIEATVSDLDLSHLLDTHPERAALDVMVRRFTAGRITAYALVSWAHTYIGHDGDRDFLPFVNLYDAYDEYEYIHAGDADTDLHQWTTEEAEAFLAGRPSSRGLGRTNIPAAGPPRVPSRRLTERLRRLIARS